MPSPRFDFACLGLQQGNRRFERLLQEVMNVKHHFGIQGGFFGKNMRLKQSADLTEIFLVRVHPQRRELELVRTHAAFSCFAVAAKQRAQPRPVARASPSHPSPNGIINSSASSSVTQADHPASCPLVSFFRASLASRISA